MMRDDKSLALAADPQAGSRKARAVQMERLISDLRKAWPGLLLWVGFVAFLALVQFSTPDIPDNDGYYHIKLAYLMRTQGLTPDFPWLPLSILNPREFYDHHFLFHTVLIPFTFGDLRLGAKLAAVLFASLAFMSTWNLLKNQRIPFAWLWAVGLAAVSEAFIFRMSIPRAQSLSLAVLMLGMDWLLRKKIARLAVLAFIYVWLYDAFPLLLILAGVYVLSAWMLEGKPDFQPLLSIAIGISAGLLINPYFPYNIVFTWQHILPKLFESTAVSVGSEWYPYDTAQLLKNSPLALAAAASGALALGLSGRKIDLRTLFSFGLTGLFGIMLFQSRRFIEYFPAFSLVFAAFAWTPVIEGQRAKWSGQVRRWLPAAAAALILLPNIWLTFTAAQSGLQSSKPYQTYQAASAWLVDNTVTGTRIFQTDWDDFPRLFFYNTHNTYLIGLDPTYMSLYDANLYQRWVDITQGDLPQPSTAIRQEFGASYILTDLNHHDFLDRAAEDAGLEEKYRDEYAVIFAVKNQPD